MPLNVAFIGEAMIELTARSDAPDALGFSPAGDVLNTGVYFTRAVQQDISASFVSVLGKDPFSTTIRDFIAGEGLQVDSLRQHPTRSCGLYSVSTGDTGERSFNYWRSASAARDLFSDDADFRALKGQDILYLTGITLAIIRPEARQALKDWITVKRQEGVRIGFDSNYRPALWEDVETARKWTEAFWRMTDIAFPSVDDEMALFGDEDADAVLRRFAAYKVGTGALKCGADGAHLLGNITGLVPAQTVAEVVDTTAAGDSFNAAFLAAHLQGADAETAAEAGQALARKVIQHPGAIIPRG